MASDSTPWYLRSSHPVLFPTHEGLTMPQAEFDSLVRSEIASHLAKQDVPMKDSEPAKDDKAKNDPESNMTRTKNNDDAYISTGSPVADLFAQLNDHLTSPNLGQLLRASWDADATTTLRIIFNARSIHLGKSSRRAFYRCAGWLYAEHPLTLVGNLAWLTRPVISTKEGEEAEYVVVDNADNKDSANQDPLFLDIPDGVSHGYWKDLLNMVALAAHDALSAASDPRDVLNVENPDITARKAKTSKSLVSGKAGHRRALERQLDVAAIRESYRRPKPHYKTDVVPTPKETRRAQTEALRQAAADRFDSDPLYRSLHLTVARLFADQLSRDLTNLQGSAKDKRGVSLCGKWAPSHGNFHDRHTLLTTSIAEILHPRDAMPDLDPAADRETYLRHARELYRRDISRLRAHLGVVERDVTAGTLSSIKYERVPSLAMSRYWSVFAERDFERFDAYTDRVAEGKAGISGATLNPSSLVSRAESLGAASGRARSTTGRIEGKVLDGQWRALVQRIRDAGTLESSIAVCDVSGSMFGPMMHDNTRPLDSSIALSLLVATVNQQPDTTTTDSTTGGDTPTNPFAGSFITFSNRPRIQRIDTSLPLTEQVSSMSNVDWGMNTDLVAVFEKVLLPQARKHHLDPSAMVRRVFVFTDMHFDSGVTSAGQWASSHKRIRESYDQAGYPVPELVFWNLASQEPAPLPVGMEDTNTSIVTGYSAGMLKVFLDGGGFDGADEEDEVVEEEAEEEGEEGEEGFQDVTVKKKKKDPLATVRKAVGHRAYSMFKVLD